MADARHPRLRGDTMDKFTFAMVQHSEHKHSIRYDAADGKAPVKSIYVARLALGSSAPAELTVTVGPK